MEKKRLFFYDGFHNYALDSNDIFMKLRKIISLSCIEFHGQIIYTSR